MSSPRAAKTCVSDTTPVCDRLAKMEALANDGVSLRALGILADRVVRAAEPLYFRSPVKTGDWRQKILAWEALRLIHSLPYVPESSPKDCYQSVDVTIRQGGECKALTTLLVALFRRLGLTAQVEWIMQSGRPLNHVSATVLLDGTWLWADASIRGAALGESPYHALERTGAYHVVGGQPVEPAGVAAPLSVALHAPPRRHGAPFSWPGWAAVWGAWPSWWWARHYPYLYYIDYYPAYLPACFAYAGATYCPLEETT